MKNLANCNPREFFRQASRIRKAAEKWLTDTDIMNIRKNMPDLAIVPEDADDEKKAEVIKANREKLNAQSKKNLSKMLDAILDEHPDETLELIALLCFVEPEHVDDHTVDEYLEAITEMISNKAVVSFFTSLAQLGLMNSSSAAKA